MQEKPIDNRIARLAMKWQEGSLTPAEGAELDAWYAGYDDSLLEAGSDCTADVLKERIYQALLRRAGLPVEVDAATGGPLEMPVSAGIDAGEIPAIGRTHGRRIFGLGARRIAAAAILVLLAAGTWFLVQRRQGVRQDTTLAQDIAPGGNKAILTLAGGQQIVLTNAQNGRLARQGSATIEKTAEGTIRYAGEGRTGEMQWNTIATPRGGQYTVTLSDGTLVMLNAASSLRYPASFGKGPRQVELKGEAWFRVADDASHPFIVTTGVQQVKVLGTAFDINAYEDEPGIRTTLLAGSIRISDSSTHRSVLLKPGQQALLRDKDLSFEEADTEEAIAWTNGFFVFQGEDIASIMRKISRWYDVDVVFTGPPPTDVFNGKIRRLVNVSQVLHKLALTNKVHFAIEGRTIQVSR